MNTCWMMTISSSSGLDRWSASWEPQRVCSREISFLPYLIVHAAYFHFHSLLRLSCHGSMWWSLIDYWPQLRFQCTRNRQSIQSLAIEIGKKSREQRAIDDRNANDLVAKIFKIDKNLTDLQCAVLRRSFGQFHVGHWTSPIDRYMDG